MRLTWEKYDSGIFGPCQRLTGLPDASWAVAVRAITDAMDAGFIATACFDGVVLSHRGPRLKTAMRRLEKEIDKRSIGLLGVDDVEFVHA